MSSWRFPRFSSRRRPHLTETSSTSGDDNAFVNPPRYSNLSMTNPEAFLISPAEASSVPVVYSDADYAPSRSFSRMSQLSPPTYVTYDDPDSRSISSSTVTLTNPPRYSGLSNAPNSDATNQEYSYTIRSGLKSEPWATLRLYDAAPHASKRTRHPRFTNKDDILGSVELSLANSQVIKNIELTVRSSIAPIVQDFALIFLHS